YRENVNAAYVNFSHNVTDKFSYRAGLRFEHTGIALEQKATADDTSYHYFDLFPNINLNYNFSSANSLSLSYAYRITRPDYNSLNPFVSQSSQFSYTSGNPDLLPEYSHRVDLNLRLFYMIFIQASYGYNNDEINNITTAYPGSFMATIQKPYNIGYQQFASLSLSGMLPLGPVEWTFWLRGSYLQAFADSPLLQMNVEQFNFTTWQSLTIKLPWELKLSVNGFYMSGMYQQGMEMDGMMMFSTALTRQFFKKALRVSLGVNNIPAQKMEINSSLNNYRMQSFMMWDKPFVSLHLQYSFGKTANNNSIKRLQSDDMDDRKGEGGGVEQPGGSGMGQ
ncbi:MAG: TonB-dependent receptor family protein, partial [Bacteroidales bacterium]|nr:TonB-dependent receptor family protein [Bacteroidales bacterium]